VLRVATREAVETPDPPEIGLTLAALHGPFTITRWEAGRRAVYAANENAPGGRPFVDGVEVELDRPLREQSIDLGLGRADVIELGAAEPRRAAPGRRVWSSSPVRLLALVCGPRMADARIREALSLVMDRQSIHGVLLQSQGEITGALLPQWLTGYAFLFPSERDAARARSLTAGLPAPSRTFTLGAEDSAWQTVAARIALNARDAGLTLTVAPSATADVRLVEVRIRSIDPARALAETAAALSQGETPADGTPEALYAAERGIIDSFRVIPLLHLPFVWGAAPRVKGEPGITPLGGWSFESLWLEPVRP
jgi:peptide/nickel transport system substrate-binding protein